MNKKTRSFFHRYGILTLPGLLLTFLTPGIALAAGDGEMMDFTSHWVGMLCVALFVAAYLLVIGEESLHLRKSKPVIVAAGLIWALVAMLYAQQGDTTTAEHAIRHNILEFAELFLFLLAAMTYINTMDERGVFDMLRVWLVSRGFSLRTIYWITGLLAFVISPVADNLTTALLMATVAIAVGGKNTSFVTVACINIVVAANAGGAFSPFGDITTLMVWQKGVLHFHEFFSLFIPSLVNWMVPAAIMSMTIANAKPEPVENHNYRLRHGAMVVVALFILTIVMAVSSHNFLHMPPVLGMMTGLGFLKFFGYYLKKREEHKLMHEVGENEASLGGNVLNLDDTSHTEEGSQHIEDHGRGQYNIFKSLEKAEWDTLMFFYGIILCVGGLGTLGYLSLVSELMFDGLGATNANILVGLLSSVIDNIPVMFAVLSMMPDMSHGHWLLVTLTAGVGGSLLSIGSAAGVAVMGTARGVYTFMAHLKWTWAIALGYAASIWVHFLINSDSFSMAVGMK